MASDLRDVARLRLAAQRLVGEPAASPTAAVRELTCMQAQDLPGAVVSVALRSAGGSRADVHAAMAAGEVVRSWPMRGTLHLVPAENLGWMLDLTTDRLLAGARSRREALGLTPAVIDAAGEAAVGALSGGRRLRRAELVALWEEAGLLGVPQRGYHLLWHLSQTGTLCLGPWRDGEQDVVLLAEWVPAPRRLDREEALGEWALRYFRSHGPATVKDLAWWTKLVMADVRVGVAVARPHLERLDVHGVEHLMAPGTPERLAAAADDARGVLLLPGFDEYLLGYQNRTAVLAPEHARLVVPGGNGVFRPTVVADGRVVGTWRRVGAGTRRRVEAVGFEPLAADVAAAAQARAATLP